MHHFFVNPEQVEDGLIRITGSDEIGRAHV